MWLVLSTHGALKNCMKTLFCARQTNSAEWTLQTYIVLDQNEKHTDQYRDSTARGNESVYIKNDNKASHSIWKTVCW